MLQISEIVRKTEEMFDLFNEHFYEGELNHPAITVSPDGGRGAYGWCSINEIWNASGEKYREINLCAEYLDRPIFELTATLCMSCPTSPIWCMAFKCNYQTKYFLNKFP
ncbi:hypothetical protein [Eshraghiella crossota]|uniref:hypothetical protein n=1 Tax=Eshraghiella crossota TaxID=45851 RepID=UPI003FD8C1B0